MKTIYCIITNLGDGSNGLEWYKNTPIKTLLELEKIDPDIYSSGDGIQIHEIKFPDNINLEELEGIFWADDEVENYYGALT